MKVIRSLVLCVAVVVFSTFLESCSSVPVTGRKQLSIIPSSTLLSMSYQQYDEFLQSNRVSADAEKTALVKRVGRRIQGAVEEYFRQKNLSDHLKDYRWEFNLVESDDVNAWCMPGGKVVIYTGILPVTQTEEGLAVVMGHEVAHAVAEHGRERMSQGLLAQLGGLALDRALSEKPEQTRSLWFAAFGIGAQVGVLLPFSRLHESEADHLGLIFMAMAGYDPNQAVSFWERMAQKKGGQSPPEFLSTHPSDETRIRQIREKIPEAMQYYRNQ
jgi:predicted Zn-dependent protease